MTSSPTQEEVVGRLRRIRSVARRPFRYATGLHSNEYLKGAAAMRYSRHQRMMSVGLSRLLARTRKSALSRRISRMVAPTTGGMVVGPSVVRGVARAAGYWSEREHDGEPLRFRQFHAPGAGRAGGAGG